MDYYTVWQMLHYGNAVPQAGEPETESGASDKEVSDKWVEDNEQMNLIEQSF